MKIFMTSTFLLTKLSSDNANERAAGLRSVKRRMKTPPGEDELGEICCSN